MEISTRFAGTFGVSKSLDVNLPLFIIVRFSDMDVDFTPNQCKIITADKLYVDRYMIDCKYERVYLDFDDTLVFNKKEYNQWMFLFFISMP